MPNYADQVPYQQDYSNIRRQTLSRRTRNPAVPVYFCLTHPAQ